MDKLVVSSYQLLGLVIAPPLALALMTLFAWLLVRGLTKRFTGMEESVAVVTKAVAPLPELFEEMKGLRIVTSSHSLSLHDMRRDARDYATRAEMVDGLGRTGGVLHKRVDAVVLDVEFLKRGVK